MTSTEARGASATREFALALAERWPLRRDEHDRRPPVRHRQDEDADAIGFTSSGALASARQILSSEGAVGFIEGACRRCGAVRSTAQPNLRV